jgi:hypothetical protein
MAHNTRHSRNTRRIAASWVGVAAALLATGTLATAVAAGGSENPRQSPASENAIVDVDDPYVACMRSAGGSPDTLEQWVDACTRAAGAFEQRYLECLHEVGGSADTLERWVAPCRQQAASRQAP